VHVLLIGRLLRAWSKVRFRLLGLATIKDIRTEQFNELVGGFAASGWTKTYEYAGYDAWIDYGAIRLRKGRWKLKLEWDNWTEGSIEGRPEVLEEIARDHDLTVTHEWRWSD